MSEEKIKINYRHNEVCVWMPGDTKRPRAIFRVQGPVGNPPIYPVVRDSKVRDYSTVSEEDALHRAYKLARNIAEGLSSEFSLPIDDLTQFVKNPRR